MMEQIKKLEKVMAGWYERAPHLPENGQKWLTENAWWIILVGVILNGFGVIAILFGTLFAGTLLTTFGGVVGLALSGVLLAAVLTGMALSVLQIVLLIMAIAPLKAGEKKGWNYLFIAYLVFALAVVVGFLFHLGTTGGLGGLIWGAIWLAIGGYFIFEIRSFMLRQRMPVSSRKSVE